MAATTTEATEIADVQASQEGNEGGGEMDGTEAAAGTAQPFNLDDGSAQPYNLDNNDDDDGAADGGSAAAAAAAQEPFSLEARRRLKQEAYMTRGCGKNEVKARTVSTFWENVWPALELLGWIKVPGGGGAQIGSVNFIPYGESQETGKKGTDYYDKIKDVLDRIQERRNDEEAKIADAYDDEIVRKQEEEETRKKAVADAAAAAAAAAASGGQQQQQKRKRKFRAFTAATKVVVSSNSNKEAAANKLLHPLDLRWKNAGRIFPKRQSQIGPDYQVAALPEAGSYTPLEAGQELRTLIWDPVAALEKGAVTESTTSPDVFETILDQIPCNKREGALFLLAERGYDPTDFLQIVQDAVKPTDGSEWSDKQRKDFSYHVFRSRKDLSSVCKALDITMHSCLLYYYGEFKHTDDYRFVKTICNDESAAARSSRQFEAAQDACAVCDDGGSLVICDGCEGEYHIECLRPPLKSVPEGHWECDECVDRKVLAVHDFLIRTTALFQRDTTGKATVAANALEGGDGGGADDAKKRNSSDGAEDSLLASPSSDKMGFRPTAASVASIRKLAGSISEAFTCVPHEPKEGDAVETSTNRMDVETAQDDNGRSEDV